jgi:hypothetical protein
MYISGCGSKFASKMDGFSGPKEDNLKVFPFLVAMPIGPFSPNLRFGEYPKYIGTTAY